MLEAGLGRPFSSRQDGFLRFWKQWSCKEDPSPRTLYTHLLACPEMTKIHQCLLRPAHWSASSRNLQKSAYSVCQHPAAVASVFDGGEQEMHVLSNPALESIAVVAEMRRARIGEHVGVGEPTT